MPDARLRVAVAENAVSCPAQKALSELVAQARGPEPLRVSASYVVQFSRIQSGFRAAFWPESAPARVRTLEDRGPDCKALARAVALSLALLIEAQQRVESDLATTPSSAPLHRVPQQNLSFEAPAAVRGMFRLSVGPALGIVRPVAPALFGGVGVGIKRVQIMIGALAIPTQAIQLGAGTVEVSLVSGWASLCYDLWRSDDFTYQMGACGGALLGRIEALARDYPRESDTSKSWLAVALEGFAAVQMARGVFFDLRLGLVLPEERQSFSIEGIGKAYEPSGAELLILPSLSAQLF